MANHSKIALYIASFCAIIHLFFLSNIQAIETKKLQIILKPIDSLDFAWSRYMPSSGDPLLRPAGSYVLLYGPIFKGGTVSKNQASFLVDKHGNPLELDDSLGRFFEEVSVFEEFDFANLAVSAGKTVATNKWTFSFTGGKDNRLFAMLDTTIVAEGGLVLVEHGTVVGGSGCNADQKANEIDSAKAYFAPDGSGLVKIKFKKSICYHKN